MSEVGHDSPAPPDLKHGGIAAVEAKVHEDRGKELKEAIPVSLKLVGALEHLLVSYAGKEDRVAATVFLFWIMILIDLWIAPV